MQSLPDLINAAFEMTAGAFMLLNVRRLMRDKLVRGVDWRATAFFTSWGAWNLYYYPHLGQTWSFGAGVFIGTVNLVYLCLMTYYIREERKNDGD